MARVDLHEPIHTSPLRAGPQPRRPMRIWDVILTSVLLAAAVLAIPAVLLLSVFSIGALDACAPRVCNEELLLRGWGLVLVAPPVIVLAAGIFSVVRLRARRLAFWIPLVALVAIGACVQAAHGLLLLAVPG